ncbi:MAG: hypothetical protein H0T91_11850 [Propionibacteriaceae bacterium]|nr:hypothetical protein [Propionibacteriaceae bacterium]
MVEREWLLRIIWWRRTLLSFGILVVSLSLVGMHQLSINHAFATAELTSQTAGDTRAHHHADRVHQRGTADAGVLDERVMDEGRSGSATIKASVTMMPAAMMDDVTDGDCATCGSHAMLFASCLLALTLLVLSWQLRHPRWRPVPFFLTRPPTPSVSSLGRRRPPLSVVELSLRRT